MIKSPFGSLDNFRAYSLFTFVSELFSRIKIKNFNFLGECPNLGPSTIIAIYNSHTHYCIRLRDYLTGDDIIFELFVIEITLTEWEEEERSFNTNNNLKNLYSVHNTHCKENYL